jgi:amino acid permease
MAHKTSHHILSTSANLLGFCLIVLTSLHLTDSVDNHLLDELTSVIALLLTVSTLLSFLSLRTQQVKKAEQLERTADGLFMGSLFGIIIIILFLLIHFWQL